MISTIVAAIALVVLTSRNCAVVTATDKCQDALSSIQSDVQQLQSMYNNEIQLFVK